MAVVRILGIDPGTVIVGYGCLELREAVRDVAASGAVPVVQQVSNFVRSAGGAQRLQVVDAGVLQLGRRQAVPERLLVLAVSIAKLIDQLRPDEVALEEAFYGKSVQSALRIGEARGVVLAESARHSVPVHQFAPARVKRCVTGQGAARKELVASMLGRLLPPASSARLEGLPADATDALAVAFTRAEQRRSAFSEGAS